MAFITDQCLGTRSDIPQFVAPNYSKDLAAYAHHVNPLPDIQPHCENGCYNFHSTIMAESSEGGGPRREISARTLFDTGSEIELISRSFVVRVGLAGIVKQSPKPKQLAGFGAVQCIAKEEIKLTWYYNGEPCPRDIVCFLIEVPEDDFDVLLGGAFLHRNNLLVTTHPKPTLRELPMAKVRMLKQTEVYYEIPGGELEASRDCEEQQTRNDEAKADPDRLDIFKKKLQTAMDVYEIRKKAATLDIRRARSHTELPTTFWKEGEQPPPYKAGTAETHGKTDRAPEAPRETPETPGIRHIFLDDYSERPAALESPHSFGSTVPTAVNSPVVGSSPDTIQTNLQQQTPGNVSDPVGLGVTHDSKGPRFVLVDAPKPDMIKNVAEKTNDEMIQELAEKETENKTSKDNPDLDPRPGVLRRSSTIRETIDKLKNSMVLRQLLNSFPRTRTVLQLKKSTKPAPRVSLRSETWIQ